MNAQKVIEYRGVDNVVVAEVITDDNEESGGYITGTVKPLVPAAEVSKETETSSEVKHYDNRAALVINSEGPDKVSITGAGMDIEVLAWIKGASYDPTTGAMIEGKRKERYFAVGYRTMDTDGNYRCVWRYKGTFAPPVEAAATVDNGTDGKGTELEYTGIHTNHIFQKGTLLDDGKWEPGTVKGMVVDSGKGLADLTTFFDKVTTPDDLTAKTSA